MSIHQTEKLFVSKTRNYGDDGASARKSNDYRKIQLYIKIYTKEDIIMYVFFFGLQYANGYFFFLRQNERKSKTNNLSKNLPANFCSIFFIVEVIFIIKNVYTVVI